MELGLRGKVALVTGSYRGTGAGIARILAEEGASVLVHGFEPGQSDAVVQELLAASLDARAVHGDIRTDDGADRVAEASGAVDVLVNNYGVAEGRGWFSGTSDDWVDAYEKNVLSGVRLVQRLVPSMRDRGFGRVIFVSTVGTARPGSRTPHYYASKAALPNLALGLAKELAGTGITVNVVSPGLIATREVRERFERLARERGWGDDWDEIQRRASREFMRNPTGRIGTVEEVGQLVAFLASERAGYINGGNVRIDGGSADSVQV